MFYFCFVRREKFRSGNIFVSVQWLVFFVLQFINDCGDFFRPRFFYIERESSTKFFLK